MMALDVVEAKLHWNLSRYAYRDPVGARQAVEGLGLVWGKFYDSGGSTQAFTCGDGSRIIVAFRGSEEEPIDWIRNAEFRSEPGELGGRVHSGHHRALNEVWSDLRAGLLTAGVPVSTTGHSLGAALATLAAARLAEANAPAQAVYTFGQPRIGKSDFEQAYEDLYGSVTFRFVNHIDLVIRVPFLLLGYRHVGRRMYFDESGAFMPDAEIWTVVRDDLSFRLRHWGSTKSIGITPHLKDSYTARMDGLEPAPGPSRNPVETGHG